MIPRSAHNGDPAASVRPSYAKVVVIILVQIVTDEEKESVGISRENGDGMIEDVIEVKLVSIRGSAVGG